MFSYLWDPNAAGLVPDGMLRSAAHRIAVFAAPRLPDLRTSVLPQALFGALGMLALVLVSWRRLRARAQAGAMEAVGLGVAWFGLGAAGNV